MELKIEDCRPEYCKYCGEKKLSKLGFIIITGGRKLQRYKCNVCGRTFTRNREGEQ